MTASDDAQSPGGHVDESLLDYVLGALEEDARRAVDVHLRACARCRAEVDAATEDLAVAALAVPPAAPPPALRARVLASVEKQSRFEGFVDVMARLCDLAKEQAADLLAAVDDAARWMAGPADGVSLFHIDGGPARADAIVGFVQIAPGASFPRHGHLGDESMLVLQGSCRTDDGRVYRRGELVETRPGESHSYTAEPGPPFIYLVVVEQGITFDTGDGDDVVGPGDPRL